MKKDISPEQFQEMFKITPEKVSEVIKRLIALYNPLYICLLITLIYHIFVATNLPYVESLYYLPLSLHINLYQDICT